MTIPDASNTPAARPKPVLIVDDNPDVCRVLARLLSLSGVPAACALGGAEALEAITSFPPALVILDVMMPGMGGFELLGRVRRDPRSAAVPVVMYSALSDDDTREEARRLGADDYWVKSSLDLGSLMERVRSMLPPA